MRFLYSSLFLLSSSLVSATVLPLTTHSKTQVELNSDPNNINHFIINVKRLDDLVNEHGAEIAQKVYGVRLSVDIVDEMVRVNGEPVAPVGGSSVAKIKTKYLVGGDHPWMDKIVQSQLGEGIVEIKVSSQVEHFIMKERDVEPIGGRHITIVEKITSLNGDRVEQDEYVEHVLDLFVDGTIVRHVTEPELESIQSYSPKAKGTLKHHGSHYGHKYHGKHGKSAFHHNHRPSIFCNWITILLLSLSSLALIGSVIYSLVYIIRRKKQNDNGYTQVETDELPAYSEKPAVILPQDIKEPTEVKEEEKITVYEALKQDQE